MATATKPRTARPVARDAAGAKRSAPSEFRVFENNTGDFHWVILAESGAVLTQSGLFSSFAAAESAAVAVRDGAASARLEHGPAAPSSLVRPSRAQPPPGGPQLLAAAIAAGALIPPAKWVARSTATCRALGLCAAGPGRPGAAPDPRRSCAPPQRLPPRPSGWQRSSRRRAREARIRVHPPDRVAPSNRPLPSHIEPDIAHVFKRLSRKAPAPLSVPEGHARIDQESMQAAENEARRQASEATHQQEAVENEARREASEARHQQQAVENEARREASEARHQSKPSRTRRAARRPTAPLVTRAPRTRTGRTSTGTADRPRADG